MSEVYLVIEGLDALSLVPEVTPKVRKALMYALNKTADKGRTSADRRIRDQVNFPASYLRPSSKRLFVRKRASETSPEAIIEGRGRPTSLARFTKQKPTSGGKGWNARNRRRTIKVNVSKGGPAREIKGAWLVNLKSGNTGLAVRTDGSKPKGAYKPSKLSDNVWLLYGPSVDQVLSAATDGDGVVTEMTPETLDFLETEFNRQLTRLGV